MALPKLGFPKHTTSEIPPALLTDYRAAGELCEQIPSACITKSKQSKSYKQAPITCGNYSYIGNSN